MSVQAPERAVPTVAPPSPSTLCSSMLRLDASAPHRLLAPRAGSICLNGAGRAPPLQQRASRWCSLHESGASHGTPSRIALAIVVPVRCAVHPPPRWVHGQTGAAPTGDNSTAGVTLLRAKSCRQACCRSESIPTLTLPPSLPPSLPVSPCPSLPALCSFSIAVSQHKEVFGVAGKSPRVAQGCFVAPSATVCGDVTLGKGSNVWYGATVRGDISLIKIGDGSNISHRAVVFSDAKKEMTIGNNVTVGVGAVVRGASIGDGASIGAGATVEPGSSVEAGAAVAPGAYVPAGTIIPAGMMFTSTGVAPIGASADAMKKAAAALSTSATAHSAEVGKTWKEIGEEKASFGWAEVKPKTLDDEFGLLEQPLEKVGASLTDFARLLPEKKTPE